MVFEPSWGMAHLPPPITPSASSKARFFERGPNEYRFFTAPPDKSGVQGCGV